MPQSRIETSYSFCCVFIDLWFNYIKFNLIILFILKRQVNINFKLKFRYSSFLPLSDYDIAGFSPRRKICNYIITILSY